MTRHGTIAPERAEIRLDADRAVRHLDRLYRYALALTGDREEAQDLVHDVVEALLRRPRLLRDAGSEVSYLMTMIRHRRLDRFRAERRLPQTVELESRVDLLGGRSGEEPDSRAEQGEVFETIRRLPAHFRDVLLAVDVAGLSYAEAATVLEVPKGTVMSRLHRARTQVATAFAVPA